jgi:hypothetical protein
MRQRLFPSATRDVRWVREGWFPGEWGSCEMPCFGKGLALLVLDG